MDNPLPWTALETTTHQDHVIAHVLGATIYGWFIADDAAHFLLDIGFLWTIYLDGEMSLLPQGVAIADLDSDAVNAAEKAELVFDAQLLLSEGYDAEGLKRFAPARVECLITGVEVFASDSARRVVIRGEIASLEIQTSLSDSLITIDSI